MTRERARQLWNAIAESTEVNGYAIMPPRVLEELREAGFAPPHGCSVDIPALDGFAWGDEKRSPLRMWLRRHREGRNRAELTAPVVPEGVDIDGQQFDPQEFFDTDHPDDAGAGTYSNNLDGQPFADDPSHPLHPGHTHDWFGNLFGPPKAKS